MTWTIDTSETVREASTEYRVTWVVEVTATSPVAAAVKARQMQLDPNSTATVFEVEEKNF